MLIVIIHRHPEIQEPDDLLQANHVASAVTTTALIALALLVAMVVPLLTYFPLLLLLLTRFVVRIWTRRTVRS